MKTAVFNRKLWAKAARIARRPHVEKAALDVRFVPRHMIAPMAVMERYLSLALSGSRTMDVLDWLMDDGEYSLARICEQLGWPEKDFDDLYMAVVEGVSGVGRANI